VYLFIGGANLAIEKTQVQRDYNTFGTPQVKNLDDDDLQKA
jgi:hypothetical protein